MSNLVSHNGTSIILSNERYVYTVFCRQMWIFSASLPTCLEAVRVRQWTLANAHCLSSHLIILDLMLSNVSALFLIWKWLASSWLQVCSLCSTACELEMQCTHSLSISGKQIDGVTMKNKVQHFTGKPFTKKHEKFYLSNENNVS